MLPAERKDHRLEVAVPSDKLSWETVAAVSVVLPVFATEKSVVVAEAVEEPIAKRLVLVSPLLVCIESLAYGEDVPMPSAPEIGRVKVELVVVAGSVPKTRLPRLNWLLAVALGKSVLYPIPMLLPPVVT